MNHKEGLHYLTFGLLEEVRGLRHGCFTRRGGVSQAPYEALNIGAFVGDKPEAVKTNRDLIAGTLGFDKLAWTKQVHGVGILSIGPRQTGLIAEGDVLVTQESGTGLLIQHADCQAALVVDPLNKLAVAIHAGWRGNVQNVFAVVINYLREVHKSRPEELLVGVSASLGPEASEFINYREEFPRSLWDYQVRDHYFDLWTITEEQLKACGVLPHHIEVARLSSHADAADWFSFRREKTTGRNGSVIGWV